VNFQRLDDLFAPTPSPGPHTSLTPPPIYNSEEEERSFTSLNAATAFLQNWAKNHGYRIRRCRLTKRGKETTTTRAYFQCEYAGKPRLYKVGSPFRIRKNTSHNADSCRFRGVIIGRDGCWKFRINHSEHSHPPFLQPSALASHRRNARSEHSEIAKQIINNLATRIEPKKTLDQLRLKFPEAPIIIKDIYNLNASYKLQQSEGLPPVQALFTNLEKYDRWLFRRSQDENNHLINVLFFNQSSLIRLRQYPSTIVLNTTYNTNRHGLYLLNIVGITATNSSFIIGQAFLSFEAEEDYSWVLEYLRDFYKEAALDFPKSIASDKAGGLINAIAEIFPGVPHLLYIWHVNNDIEAHCRRL
jgi:hypothetical protein